MAGSTGHIYTIEIKLLPSCDCPHAKKGNQCKHVVFVMLKVLKAPEAVAYQLALTISELRDVMKNAPPILGVDTDGKNGTEQPGEDPNRKPVQGECPICYDELTEGGEPIIYCKASCGNNLHEACMKNWLKVGVKPTCPYCRAKWVQDTGFDGKLGTVDMTGLERNENGYFNVAQQLGLSGERDYSTYHQYWVRQHFGQGRRRGRGRYDDFDD